MKTHNYLYICLVSIMTISFVVIIAILIQVKEYNKEKEDMIAALSNPSIVNYFDDTKYDVKYQAEDGTTKDLILKDICVDCGESLVTAHNSGSALITFAPSDVCDLSVERCVVFSYDPFGMAFLNHKEVITAKK